MRFKLYDTQSAVVPITTVTPLPYPVPVTNGLFTTEIDFGDQFTGQYRYLEVDVSCPASGGPSWQTTGRAYVKDYYDLLGVPLEEARFQDSPGWCDWYDTQRSQNLLQYQNTSYQRYLGQLQSEVEAMMGE